MLKAKRGLVCEQEQLASDLDRALSLSQLGSLGASRKLASSVKSEKSKGRSVEGQVKERGIHSLVKPGKHKMATKASAADAARKVKGPKKTALFSPMRSELSSCSNSEYLETESGFVCLMSSDKKLKSRRSFSLRSTLPEWHTLFFTISTLF